MDVADRKVVVLGLGRSGRAAAALACRHGARVVGVDLRTDVEPIEGVELQLGGPHRDGTFTTADVLVLSPGVPATNPHVVSAQLAGVSIVGELGFAASFLSAPMVAITGTNGKSTVTSLVGQLLAAAGRRPFIGGNIGTALSLADQTPHDVLVVEVSSYQLEWPAGLHPRAAALLNLTPDHLARHGDMHRYARCKVRLLEQMGPSDLALLPAGDGLLTRLADGSSRAQIAWLGALPGVVRDHPSIRVALPGTGPATFDASGFSLAGRHNLDNLGAALALCIAMGAEPRALQDTIAALTGLDHRMQRVGTFGGATWIDDSKATNVEAALAGVAGLPQPAVVLLGGQAKGGGFSALVPALRRHRGVITFGGSGASIADELEGRGLRPVRVDALSDAVAIARQMCQAGDAVLLSPGCASFDAFDDFAHRGRVFQALARSTETE